MAQTVDTPVADARRRRPRPGDRAYRRPGIGLPVAVLLALVGAFFAWVSAEPFWLAGGHGSTGTVTVLNCQARGLGQQCVGRFVGDDPGFIAPAVRVAGLAADDQRQGSTAPARMLHRDSTRAYADPVGSLHLRWLLGLALVALVGVGIGAATGAGRLRREGAGRAGWLLTMGGTLALFLGIVGAALL